MAQSVKNPPAMRETWVPSLGWEDALEEGTHHSILACRIPMDRGAWQVTVHGVSKSRTQLSNFHFHFTFPVDVLRGFNNTQTDSLLKMGYSC